jgi:hypothetical protein
MRILTSLLTIILISGFVLFPGNITAQAPEKMSYQAVIRNTSNELVKSTSVGMKISILQGSESGTALYVETHTTSTNPNGLVTIEIGGGTPVTGTFSGIDWSTGTYFIKTETDPSGGTSYSITGTSQILSVPYALFAKTSGSTNGTSGHYVGELYGGGVVFWVDKTGLHGLICSMIDLSADQMWSDVFSTLIGATAQSNWDGLSNSNAIIGQSAHTSSAAKLCLDYINADYGTGVYSDWYLPAIDQLSLLYNHKYPVNKALESDGNSATTPLTKNSYWTSTEDNDINAFVSDYSLDIFPAWKSDDGYVRAVRSF